MRLAAVCEIDTTVRASGPSAFARSRRRADGHALNTRLGRKRHTAAGRLSLNEEDRHSCMTHYVAQREARDALGADVDHDRS